MIGPFQEQDGAISMRRILAIFFAMLAIPTGIIPLFESPQLWVVFIPFGFCIGASLLCLFFTTWEAIIGLAKAIKKGE